MSTATALEEPVHRAVVQVEDALVEVDRATPLEFPEGTTEWLYPDLADTGPVSYRLSQVKPWLHHDQKDDQGLSGGRIHSYLKNGGHLRTCLGYRDALVLRELGSDCFKRYFGEGTLLFFWRSIAKTAFGVVVPQLSVVGELKIDLAPVMFRWYENAPAARFRRSVSC